MTSRKRGQAGTPHSEPAQSDTGTRSGIAAGKPPARPAARLLLDEMFSPAIADALRERKHDVVAVAEHGELRAMTDAEVFAWATDEGRWLLTENVKDLRPILLQAIQASTPMTGLLFTSSRTFPRSRQNPTPLIEALHAWLTSGPPPAPLTEDWLQPPPHTAPAEN